MVSWLKADIHLHTGEDLQEGISYRAKELIIKAAREGYQVLSITNHKLVTFTPELKEYAAEQGIILLAGMEATIQGKHVLIISPDGPFPSERIKSFADLKKIRQEGFLIIAPHPFFPSFHSLRSKLIKHLEIFDAIEYSHFYLNRLNFNLPAERIAKQHGIPLIGTSDAHTWRQFGTTYSRIKAEKKPEAIVRAIKQGAVEITTKPLKPTYAAQCYLGICWNGLVGLYQSRISSKRFNSQGISS
jgi:predicted metal-dependent phosphoesterase TrpH